MTDVAEALMVMQPHPEEEGGTSPTPPLFRKSDWEVRPVSMVISQRMVEKYHYAAGGSNTRVYTHGLFRRDELWERDCAGVTWWIPPTKSAAIYAFPSDWNAVLSLSRMVLVPGAPKNACMFLLRHSMRLLDRQRWPCLLTFADEWRGHTGKIYELAKWTDKGFTKPERTYTLNGRMVSRKAGPKTRTHKEMLELGCKYEGSFRRRRFIHIFGVNP